MNIAPTVGRMVYYKARGSADGVFPSVDRAAVVTAVQDTGLENPYQVRLCIFNPEGLFFTPWLDQGSEGGQWDWMPFQKDQQALLNTEEVSKSDTTTPDPAIDPVKSSAAAGLSAI